MRDDASRDVCSAEAGYPTRSLRSSEIRAPRHVASSGVRQRPVSDITACVHVRPGLPARSPRYGIGQEPAHALVFIWLGASNVTSLWLT